MRCRLLPDALKPLANKFYRAQRSPMRASAEDHVWVVEQQDIIAAVCLRPVAEGHWLTSLWVAQALRGQHTASQLLEHVLAQYQGPIWLFCHPDLSTFYQRLAFHPCNDLPPVLAERLSRYQRTKRLLALSHTDNKATTADCPL